MKKVLFVIIAILFSVSDCFASEFVEMKQGVDYLYFSDSKIKSIKSNNPAIISAQRVSTIKDNEQQVLFSAKRTGNAKVKIETESGITDFSIEIKAKDAKTSATFIELDVPGIMP